MTKITDWQPLPDYPTYLVRCIADGDPKNMAHRVALLIGSAGWVRLEPFDPTAPSFDSKNWELINDATTAEMNKRLHELGYE